MEKRPYKMGRRAEAAGRTRVAIIEAGLELFMSCYYSDVTLAEVARKAGVTLQTVLRRFESKEGLLLAVMSHAGQRVPDARDSVARGDIEGAVRVVVETLEGYGDATMRARRQEEQVAVLAPFMKVGHKWHRDWIARVFEDHIDTADRRERRRRVAALAAATDVYAWRLLRRDYGLSKAETEKAMLISVCALTDSFRERGKP